MNESILSIAIVLIAVGVSINIMILFLLYSIRVQIKTCMANAYGNESVGLSVILLIALLVAEIVILPIIGVLIYTGIGYGYVSLVG